MTTFASDNYDYDVVVIGGGPVGLSTAYQCAKASLKVLLLERFTLFNQSGSSNDFVRMFRTMYTEDYMADLAKEALGEWKNLQDAVGEKPQLVEMSGLLNFGDPDYQQGPEGNLLGPIENLKRNHMKYQTPSVSEIETQFPFRNLPSNFKGLWAPDNGCINVPEVVRQLAQLAERHGATLVEWATVTKLAATSEGVTVHVSVDQYGQGKAEPREYRARKCAITAGAYTNHVLEPSFGLKLDLDIWEMVYEYYAVDSRLEYPATSQDKTTLEGQTGKPFKSMWFQFAKDDETGGSNLFYGFPSVPWGPPDQARIATDSACRIIKDPSQRQLSISECDLERTRNFVQKHLKGLVLRPNFAGSCLQTNVYDNMFVLDTLAGALGEGQGGENVAVFTAGWAFKFVPLIGIKLKRMLFDGEGAYDEFKITRRDKEHSVLQSRTQQIPRSLRTMVGSGSSSYPNKPRPTQPTCPRTERAKRYAAKLKVGGSGEAKDLTDFKVGIIGAGAAGLYAALILTDLEIKCEILEANSERIGGRIFTKYLGKAKDAKDPPEPGSPEYLSYFDVGAMRFPCIPIQKRVIGEVDWSLVNYLNKHLPEEKDRIRLIPYFLSRDQNWMYFNGIWKRAGEAAKEADPFDLRPFPDAGACCKVPTYDKLLDAAMGPFKEKMAADFNKGFLELSKYDSHSIRSFLHSCVQDQGLGTWMGYYTDRVIDWCETFDASTGSYTVSSFTEGVMDSFDFDNPDGSGWKCIEGGTSRLISGMEKVLENKVTIEKGCKVTKIAPLASDKVNVSFTRTTAEGSTEDAKEYDHVVSTLPFSMLRHIDFPCKLGTEKQEAMRLLHYDNSVKVGILFKSRFWQDRKVMKGHEFLGGTSSTDLPSRTIVYPSYGGANSPGIIIASYTWVQDANRMGGMTHEGRLGQCLRDLSKVHEKDLHDPAAEQGLTPLKYLEDLVLDSYSHSWYHDPFAQGAFALYGPGQFTKLFEGGIAPELGGHLHFAGEATSVHHAWIVGSLNSAYRSVAEILCKLQDEKRIELLVKNWGPCDEVELDKELGSGERETKKRRTSST